MRVLRGHEPSRAEMQDGIPSGLEDQVAMGGIPFAIGAVAIALGSGVYSVFDYINDHEERIAQQTATPLERGMRLLSDNIWGVAAVGAVVGGVYVYHRTQTAGERKHERELEKIRTAKGLEENPDNGADEAEETFFSKAKAVVKNSLFPAEKNPDMSAAQRLNVLFEKLNDAEQDHFIAIINGEEPAEPELEEEEPEENPEEPEPDATDTDPEPEPEETEAAEEGEVVEEGKEDEAPEDDEGEEEEEQEESDD